MTPTRIWSSARSPNQPAPERSATARCGYCPSSRSYVCAPATPTSRRSRHVTNPPELDRASLAQRRADRALEADRRLRQLFTDAVPTDGDPREGSGIALVAVGGYGRS